MRDETGPRELLERTREALPTLHAEEAETPRHRGQPPEPGDLFVLSETAEQGLEWLVLERSDAAPPRWLAVPADVNPLAGSADVEVPAGAPAGPLTLRCGFGVWLGEATFTTAQRTGTVDAARVREALGKWRSIEAGTLRGGPLEREVDTDPEYADWREEVLEPARAALRVPRARSDQPAADRRRQLRLFGSVAATLTVAVVGLGIWSASLHQQVRHLSDQLAQPIVVRAAGELPLGERTRGRAELRVPPGDSPLLLFVILDPATASHERYRLELENAESGATWRSPPLTEISPGEIWVLVPKTLLAPGHELRSRLFAESEGALRLLDTTSVRLIQE